MAVKRWERKVITKPRYSFPLNSPHQSMMRLTVWNISSRLPSRGGNRPILGADVGAPHFLIEGAGRQQLRDTASLDPSAESKVVPSGSISNAFHNRSASSRFLYLIALRKQNFEIFKKNPSAKPKDFFEKQASKLSLR